MKALNRKISVREAILLIVLVLALVVGCYFLLVYYPIRDRESALADEMEAVELRDTVASARLETYKMMMEAIAEIEKIPEAERTEIPIYNETTERELLTRLHIIFDDLTEPNVTYNEPRLNSYNIYERVVNFSFKVELDDENPEGPQTAYEQTKTILTRLTKELKHRSMLSRLTVSPDSGSIFSSEALTVSGTITFYERKA